MGDIEVFVKTMAMLFVGMFCGLAMAKKPGRRQGIPAEWDGIERRNGDDHRVKVGYRSSPNGRVVVSPYDRRK